MGLKSRLSKPFAGMIHQQTKKCSENPIPHQNKIMQMLVSGGSKTIFGADHDIGDIQNYEDFKKHVPIRDYEELSPYIQQILEGKNNVLWRGQPLYLSKTSGTTSGVKYIPITKDSISNHINSARNALLSYIHETGNSHFLNGKMIFLSGSPTLDQKAGIHTGRLSGIVNHHVPKYLRKNQLPTFETNCIDDWEQKLDKVIEETYHEDMTLISGIPPWVQMYFDKLENKSQKKIIEIFKNFSLFVHGGVNFEPYKAKLFESIGKPVDNIETYPASEGFIAYQDSQVDNQLLLLLNSGIFFEFIPVEEYHNENPKRLCIEEVELGKNYAVIINSNAGLWGYSIGDTVKFTSLSPFKIRVTGRIKHFISAFGEHVIGQEVEKAIHYALERHPETEIREFTVAPSINPEKGKSYHEWLISFSKLPKDKEAFGQDLNQRMTELNIYYKDLIVGNILQPLKITPLQQDAFILYMDDIGKLGGQNKVPRLSNDRKIADAMIKYHLK